MGIADLATLGGIKIFSPLFEWDKIYPHIPARLIVSYGPDEVVLGVFGEFDELPADGRSPPRGTDR